MTADLSIKAPNLSVTTSLNEARSSENLGWWYDPYKCVFTANKENAWDIHLRHGPEREKEQEKKVEEEKVKKAKSTKIKSITINEKKRVVTVVFEDNSVRMSKCTEDDKFDINVGVAMCIAYQLFDGSKSAFRKEVSKKSSEVKPKKKNSK